MNFHWASRSSCPVRNERNITQVAAWCSARQKGPPSHHLRDRCMGPGKAVNALQGRISISGYPLGITGGKFAMHSCVERPKISQIRCLQCCRQTSDFIRPLLHGRRRQVNMSTAMSAAIDELRFIQLSLDIILAHPFSGHPDLNALGCAIGRNLQRHNWAGPCAAYGVTNTSRVENNRPSRTSGECRVEHCLETPPKQAGLTTLI